MSFLSGVTSASIGDTIDVSVRIDSQGQTVNAAQGTIDYPTSILQVVSVDHSNSIFNIWAQEPTVNTSTGEISFLGGSTNSFSGTSLYVLDVTFVVRGKGVATLNFANAGVTAGDGTGANILSASTRLYRLRSADRCGYGNRSCFVRRNGDTGRHSATGHSATASGAGANQAACRADHHGADRAGSSVVLYPDQNGVVQRPAGFFGAMAIAAGCDGRRDRAGPEPAIQHDHFRRIV